MMTQPDLLLGKKALVTGASRGLGEEIARMLAEAGADVCAVARDTTALQSAFAAAPRLHGHGADVSDPAFHAWLEAQDIDILVNNAGTNKPMPMADVDPQTLDHIINLNVRSLYLCSQAAVRGMLRRGGGVIIHITSQMGHVGAPNRTVYCMTKHAVEGLAKAMAVELAPHNIRVNCVAPTFIATPMTAPMLADPIFRQSVLEKIPLGRLGAPADVAAAVLYLASPMAAMVTGASLKVDGGWTAA